MPQVEGQPLTPEAAETDSRFQRLLSATGRIGHLATRSAQTTLVLLQVSPANEVVRFGAFGAAEAVAHSPVTGALSYGLATLGVEAAGALAGAPLLDTKPSERITGFLNRKLSKVSKGTEQTEQREYSKTTKLGTAFIGGTVAAMALEKLEDPTRTAQHNRRFGLWTSAWLAGACAVQGAAMSEGINLASSDTKVAGIAAATVTVGAAGGWLKRRLKNQESTENTATIKYLDTTDGTLYELVNDKQELEQAAQLEENVWREKGYGSLEEYAEHIAHARTFAAFQEGKCIGLARMFGAETNAKPPPFTELPFDDQADKAQIIEDCKKGLVEEMGTLAVAPEYRGGGMVAVHMQRLAYRDARARNIKSWGNYHGARKSAKDEHALWLHVQATRTGY